MSLPMAAEAWIIMSESLSSLNTSIILWILVLKFLYKGTTPMEAKNFFFD
jgi:hypothetical protein